MAQFVELSHSPTPTAVMLHSSEYTGHGSCQSLIAYTNDKPVVTPVCPHKPNPVLGSRVLGITTTIH